MLHEQNFVVNEKERYSMDLANETQLNRYKEPTKQIYGS